jgi:hypothetical protein
VHNGAERLLGGRKIGVKVQGEDGNEEEVVLLAAPPHSADYLRWTSKGEVAGRADIGGLELKVAHLFFFSWVVKNNNNNNNNNNGSRKAAPPTFFMKRPKSLAKEATSGFMVSGWKNSRLVQQMSWLS